MSIYPSRQSEKLIFREKFTNTNKTLENGWSLIDNPSFNNGLVLNGTSQYATIEGEKVIKNLYDNSALTIEIVFTPNFDYDDDNENYLFDTNNRYFVLKRNNANSNAILIRLKGSTVASIASATYKDYWLQGQKNRFVIAGASGNTDVYLNGHLISEANATAWTNEAPTTFYLGSYSSSATYTDMTVHELSVYSEKKEANWVSKRCNETLFGSLSMDNFILYVPFLSEYYNTTDTNIYTRDLASGEDPICTSTTVSDLGFSFNGTTSKVEYTNAYAGTGDITLGGSFLIETWGETGVIDGILFSQSTFGLGFDQGSSRMAAYGASVKYSANNSIQLGRKYNFALTRRSTGEVTFYINGEVSGTAEQSIGAFNNTGVTTIGNNTGQTRSYDGFIKKIWIYDGIMTPDQIRYMNNKMDFNL